MRFETYMLSGGDCAEIWRAVKRGEEEAQILISRDVDNAAAHYNDAVFSPWHKELEYYARPVRIEQYKALPAGEDLADVEKIIFTLRTSPLELAFYGLGAGLSGGAGRTGSVRFAKYRIPEEYCELMEQRYAKPLYCEAQGFRVPIIRNADNRQIHYNGAIFPPRYQELEKFIWLTRISQYRSPEAPLGERIERGEHLRFFVPPRPVSVIWLDGGEDEGINNFRRGNYLPPRDGDDYLREQPWREPLKREWAPLITAEHDCLLEEKSGHICWQDLAAEYYAENWLDWTDWERKKFAMAYWRSAAKMDSDKWRDGAAIKSVLTYQRNILPEKGVFELRVPKNAGAKFFRNHPWIPDGNAGDFLWRILWKAGTCAGKTETAEDYIYHIPFYEYPNLWRFLFWLEVPILYKYDLITEPDKDVPEAWNNPQDAHWQEAASFKGDKL